VAIKVELKPRPVLGYILLFIGLIMVFYSFFQALGAYNTTNEIFSGIKDKLEEEGSKPLTILQEIETPLFIETIFWFLTLVVLLASGSIIANLGIKLLR